MHGFSTVGLPAWQLELINKYPSIYKEPSDNIIEFYKQKGESVPETYCNLRYGFEFGEGWKKLIEEFSETTIKLLYELHSRNIQPDAYVHSYIFKEKFGMLTWQGNNNIEIEPYKTLFNSYIRTIENKSTQYCENCGDYAYLRNINGWRTT